MKYLKIEEVTGIVKRVRDMYPSHLFPEPTDASPPAFFAASGSRNACDAIMREIVAKTGIEDPAQQKIV